METDFTKDKNILNYTLVDQQKALEEIVGTHLLDYIHNVKYEKLVELLGQPTFTSPSDDEKVQVEWVVKYNGEVLTVYDWKTYDREYTLNHNKTWHIGGKDYGSASEFSALITDNI